MTISNKGFAQQFHVEYKYSACIKIVTHDVALLCDPWFSNQAYYGAWERYPCHNITKDFLGEFDYIWISHIHPDHYCPWSIEKLFELYGGKSLLLTDWGQSKNYLKLKLISDGFGKYIEEISEYQVGDTVLRCIPNVTGSSNDIDSYLVVHDLTTGKGILNLNDCIVSDQLVSSLTNYLEEKDISIELACLGYTGAGPYPQTYYSPATEKATLEKISSSKKLEFFDRYLSTISKIPSKYRLPFAGKYLLSSELAFMNPFRGVADALEIKQIDANAIVLDDSGTSKFNVLTCETGHQRDKYYDDKSISITQPLLWKHWINYSPNNSILQRLLRKAYDTAFLKSECNQDYVWNFFVFDSDINLADVSEHPYINSCFLLGINCNNTMDPAVYTTLQNSAEVKSNLFIDRKALFSVLTGICHWNNLEVGSGFFVRRDPDIFVREAQTFLNFLSVI